MKERDHRERERERESGERNRESQIKNERERDGDSTKSPRENVKREVWERRKRERDWLGSAEIMAC